MSSATHTHTHTHAHTHTHTHTHTEVLLLLMTADLWNFISDLKYGALEWYLVGQGNERY